MYAIRSYYDLEARREAILKSIREQGKLTDDLARAIAQAETKSGLEDIRNNFV